MRLSLYLLGLWFIPAAFAETPLPDTQITVYTTENYSLERQEFAERIYYIDAVEKLENSFSKQFGSLTGENAAKQASLLLQSPEGQEFQLKLQDAYKGIVDGWQKGVMKVPAVLFEPAAGESMVIYGETNIAKAIQRYQAFIQTNEG